MRRSLNADSEAHLRPGGRPLGAANDDGQVPILRGRPLRSAIEVVVLPEITRRIQFATYA